MALKASLNNLDELLSLGFIQGEEYEKRKIEILGAVASSSSSSLSVPSSQLFLSDEDINDLRASSSSSSSSSSQESSGRGGGRADGEQKRSYDLLDGLPEYPSRPSESSILLHLQGQGQGKGQVQGQGGHGQVGGEVGKGGKKVIRLFVSSTFKDMKEERDLLVKRVFPEIKRACRDRGINFVYVDFRWGITSEESNGGKVLSLCLTEIDKCRPWFLGVLGERYGRSASASGGIPDTQLKQSFEEAVERGGYDWLLPAYADRSVTEIEILYGSLFYPEHAKNSFFYFRNPSYIEEIGGLDSFEISRDYLAQTDLEKQRLRDLKSRIAASRLPLRDNYRDPEAFAQFVTADLLSAIEKEYPLAVYKTIGSGVVDESAIHRECSEERAAPFNSNRAHIEALVHYTIGGSGVFVLAGEYGSGKSSLVSKFIVEKLPSSFSSFSLIHFIGLTTNNLSKVLRVVITEIKKHFKLEKTLPKDSEELIHTLSEWFSLTSSLGGVVIVLDGLENLEEKYQNLSWLPLVLPERVKIIVTCRTGSKPHDVLTKRSLQSNVQQQLLTLEPLTTNEKRQLIEEYLSTYSKKLGHEHVFYLVEARQTSNPSFLRLVLEQLRVYADHDHLSDFIQRLLRAQNLDQLFEMCLAQWEKDFSLSSSPGSSSSFESYTSPAFPSSNFVQDVMCLLHCSRSGLLENELAAILNESRQTVWSSFLDSTQGSLLNQSGVLSFVNSHLREAIKRRYLSSSTSKAVETEAMYRSLIVDFFEKKAGSHRKLAEYPYQLSLLLESQLISSSSASVSKKRMLEFLSDINVFFQLYTDDSKYDLIAFWKTAVGGEQSGKCAADALTASYRSEKARRSLQEEEEEVLLKLGNFIKELGRPEVAIPLFEDSLVIRRQKFGQNSEEVARMLRDFALLYELQGNYEKALELATSCRGIREKIFGLQHPKTADSIWLMALLRKKMANYPAALLLFEQAFKIAEAHFGSNHPTVAIYLRTIGDVYRNQADFDKAESFYGRALEIQRNFFGETHPEVAEVMENLGRVAKKKGNYEMAKPYYEKALEAMERIYGDSHTKVAEIYCHLADVYRKLGSLQEAESLYRKGLNINISQLGEEHPVVGETLNQLGTIFKLTGRFEEAVKVVLKAVEIGEKSFGKDHVKVAAFLNSLADIKSITAKYDEATSLYLRALAINEKTLGTNHPECSENLNALGMISKKRGRYSEAERYYSKALQIVENIYGGNHPKVALYIHNLGVIYRKNRQFSKSLDAFNRALAINKSVFGSSHPLVAGNLIGIGLAIKKTEGGDLDEASQKITEAISIFEEKYGPEHERVGWALNYLAEIYRKQGKYGIGAEEAESVYLRALDINRKAYGEWSDHPEIAENFNGLAQVYRNQMNFDKAEPLFKQGIEISERTLGVNHPHVLNRYRNLANMYQAQGKVPDSNRIWDKIEELKKMPPLEGDG